ncbi:MAG: hypothetical protein JRG91_00140 [Deltaproteobacteria bacterium]|nr:hypothetical protein [Deltaproteobacteria bacterium]
MDRPIVRIAAAALAVLLSYPRISPAGSDLVFSADRVESDLAAEVLRATGNVQLVAPGLLVRASELWVFDTAAGGPSLLLDRAELRLVLEDRILVAAADLVVVEHGRVTFENGEASLCACDPAPLGVSFCRLEADPGGDLLVRRGWLELGGRRVLPLPWFMLRTGRKVGLLPPRIGYVAHRGLLLGLGALFPLPREWDLVVHADWLALDGLGLGAALEAPAGRLASTFFFDPVDQGLDSGWVAGSLHASSSLQHAGLVLDTLLSRRIALGDMVGTQGGSSRQALQSLGVRLSPATGWLSILGEVGVARGLEVDVTRGGRHVLAATESWMRSPSLILALHPVRLLGPHVPLLLRGEIRHGQLLLLGAATGVRLEHSGVGIDLTGRWLPGRILDLRIFGGWHGSLLRQGAGTLPALWLQESRGGAEASISLMGPASPTGLAHRLDLVLSYRRSHWAATGRWSGGAASFVPLPVPTHLCGLVLRNALVRVRAETLAVTAGAWLVPRAGRSPLALFSFGIVFRGGPLRLDTHLDLPAERWRPSLTRTTLSLASSGFSLEVGHLFVDGGSATSLDVDAWSSTLLGPGLAAGRGPGINAAMLGLVLPLGGGLALGGRVGLDLDHRASSWIEASLTYAHPCRCLKVRLVVLGRAGVAAPDVVLALGL